MRARAGDGAKWRPVLVVADRVPCHIDTGVGGATDSESRARLTPVLGLAGAELSSDGDAQADRDR